MVAIGKNENFKPVNKDQISKRSQSKLKQNLQGVHVDPAMRHLVNEVSETVGQYEASLFDQNNAMQTHETHVMLSEEEEEEDEDSDHQMAYGKPVTNLNQEDYIGEHLTGEKRQPPTDNVAPRP